MKNPNTFRALAFAASALLMTAGLSPASASTEEVSSVEINPSSSSNPRFLTSIGDYVYFTASNGVDGVEIWFTDGTADGTQMVGNINPAADAIANTYDPFFEQVGNYVYFRASNGSTGLELHRSPIGQTGFERVTDLDGADSSMHGWVGGFPTPQSNYTQGPLVPHYGNGIVSFGGKVFFIADDGSGTDVYVYDPVVTPNGANAGITNLTSALDGSMYELSVWNNSVYFVFDPTATGVEHIYKLNGSFSPELVVSAEVTNGHNGTIFRLIPTQSHLLFLESIDNPEARLRVLDNSSNPMTVSTITTTEAIKTDLGIFPAPTVLGSEVYFVTTSLVSGRTPAYRTELRHVHLVGTPVATTVTTQATLISSVNMADRTFSPVVQVGTDRYVIKLDAAFDHNLYPITGSVLGAKIADAGSLYSTMATFGSSLAHSAVINGNEDLGLLSSGLIEPANRGTSMDTFTVKEIATAGDNLVVSAQSPNSGNWDLFLFAPEAAVTPGNPAPYEGPTVLPILGEAAPGETVKVIGTELDEVTKAEIDNQAAVISNQTDTSLDLTLPADLTPGLKDLTLTSNYGLLTVQSFVTIRATSVTGPLSIGEWTKLQANGTSLKFYSKNPVGKGKIQFFADGREIAWVRAADNQDPKLSFASGSDYLVRTLKLKPGKNRVEIKIDGIRVWRATYVPKS